MVDRRCQRDSKQEVISLETSYQRRVADKQAAINVWAVMLLLLLLLRQRVTQDSGQQIDLIGESRQPPGRHRRLSIISWPTLRSAEINASSGPPARSFVRSLCRAVVVFSLSRPANLLWLTRSDVHRSRKCSDCIARSSAPLQHPTAVTYKLTVSTLRGMEWWSQITEISSAGDLWFN